VAGRAEVNIPFTEDPAMQFAIGDFVDVLFAVRTLGKNLGL
jgi:hypothetical protein